MLSIMLSYDGSLYILRTKSVQYVVLQLYPLGGRFPHYPIFKVCIIIIIYNSTGIIKFSTNVRTIFITRFPLTSNENDFT